MMRLLVHVEGQTEETFVNDLLRPHLLDRGYSLVSARLLGNARLRTRRGGIKAWSSVKDDICRHLKGDDGCIATTMVDYYALPATGGKAWPGRETANTKHPMLKAQLIQEAMTRDISDALAAPSIQARFVPFVVMHEFEALLFSDCGAFARGISRPDLGTEFQRIRDAFPTPENINDSPMTAPSKRVEALIPGYEKPFLGVLAALEIGLQKIRNECPHFSNWLDKLEAIGLRHNP